VLCSHLPTFLCNCWVFPSQISRFVLEKSSSSISFRKLINNFNIFLHFASRLFGAKCFKCDRMISPTDWVRKAREQVHTPSFKLRDSMVGQIVYFYTKVSAQIQPLQLSRIVSRLGIFPPKFRPILNRLYILASHCLKIGHFPAKFLARIQPAVCKCPTLYQDTFTELNCSAGLPPCLLRLRRVQAAAEHRRGVRHPREQGPLQGALHGDPRRRLQLFRR
jgi:hypothetical protein